jgi:hypothetical protein
MLPLSYEYWAPRSIDLKRHSADFISHVDYFNRFNLVLIQCPECVSAGGGLLEWLPRLVVESH